MTTRHIIKELNHRGVDAGKICQAIGVHRCLISTVNSGKKERFAANTVEYRLWKLTGKHLGKSSREYAFLEQLVTQWLSEHCLDELDLQRLELTTIIKIVRAELMLTQGQLAQILDISRYSLIKYETLCRIRPRHETLVKLRDLIVEKELDLTAFKPNAIEYFFYYRSIIV